MSENRDSRERIKLIVTLVLIIVVMVFGYLSYILLPNPSWELVGVLVGMTAVNGVYTYLILYAYGIDLLKFHFDDLRGFFKQLTNKETKDALAELTKFIESENFLESMRKISSKPPGDIRIISRSEYADLIIKDEKYLPRSLWIKGVSLEAGSAEEIKSEIHYRLIEHCLSKDVQIKYLCRGENPKYIEQRASNLAKKLKNAGLKEKSICVRLMPIEEISKEKHTIFNAIATKDIQMAHRNIPPYPDFKPNPAWVYWKDECEPYIADFEKTWEKSIKNDEICKSFIDLCNKKCDL